MVSTSDGSEEGEDSVVGYSLHKRSSSTSSSPTAEALALAENKEPSTHTSATPLYNDDTYQQRTRATSISSFTFAPIHIRQTSFSGPSHVQTNRDGGGQAERHLTVVSSVSLVVGMQIGSGIFSSPGSIVSATGSIGASLLVWLVAGLLAHTGAASFAELGAAIPLDGGAAAYLSYAYGPLPSYLFSWTAITALKPGGSAIIALIFGEYVNRLIWHLSGLGEEAPGWSIKLTASIAIIVISILNLLSPSSGTKTQVLLTSIKAISLIAIILLGLVTLILKGPGDLFGGLPSKTGGTGSGGFWKGTETNPSEYAVALYSGLWAYDGWDQSNYVAGQMINPTRDLPLTIHFSMISIIILFLLTNIAYFIVLSKDVVGASNTVALDFGKTVFGFGSIGGSVASVVVGISCFGALNGGFYTTARLIYSAGKENFIPSMFSHLHPRRQTPDNAMALQAISTILFVVAGGGFRSLINFFSVANWTFLFTTVLGLLVLRVKEPNLERPYRTWLITPIVFCAVALFLLFMPIFAAPLEAVAAFAFILAGVPAYYLFGRARSMGTKAPESTIGKLKEAFSAMIADLRRIIPTWLGGNRRQSSDDAGYARIEMTER